MVDVSKAAVPRRLNSVRLNLVALLALVLCLSSGCVSRRMTVRTDPPGALVMLEGEKIGYSPVSFDTTYYGTREITLVKPGYETLTTLQKISPPWYQIPPLDFISDNFLPFKLTNRQDFFYAMNPEYVYPTQEILERGRQLRSESQLGN